MSVTVNVVIPTYDRADRIGDAVEAALGQQPESSVVTVIDDGSDDDTLRVLARHEGNPRFRHVALERNVGTAQAKNVAIALNDCEFITFHDSDDLPAPDKVSRQLAVATDDEVRADPVLNWALVDTPPGSRLPVDLVVGEHVLVTEGGERHHMRRALSLVDDVFPNLQMAAGVPGDWILINCGLFRASVFAALGGFRDCIEEDRDMRNRLIFDGRVIWLIPEILLTKHECADSLTVSRTTSYDSERRRQDRTRIWRDAFAFRAGRRPAPEPISLPDIRFRHLSGRFSLSNALMETETRGTLTRELARRSGSPVEGRSRACPA